MTSPVRSGEVGNHHELHVHHTHTDYTIYRTRRPDRLKVTKHEDHRVSNREFSRQTASAPNRLPNPQKAVGPSVRGFMFCIAAHHCLPIRSPGLDFMLSFADQGTYDSNVHLEEADRFAHRRLDMQRLDILPVFLE